MGFLDRFRKPDRIQPAERSSEPHVAPRRSASPEAPGPYPAEEQLAELERLGIRLRPDLTLDDVLVPEGQRGWAEKSRFGILESLAVGGADADVPTVPGIAYIHLEAAEDDESYPWCVRVLAHAAGRDADLTAVGSSFDPESATCRVDYEIAGRRHHLEPDVRGDWMDGMALGYIAEDLAPEGATAAWWFRDDALLATWLPRDQAHALMDLMNGT